MTNRVSLRWMILGPMLLIITAGFIGFGVYVDGVEYRHRITDVDQELQRAAAARRLRPPDVGEQLALPPAEPEIGGIDPPVELLATPSGDVVTTGRAINPFDAATLARLARVFGVSTIDSPRYRVLVQPADNGFVEITGLPLAGVDAAIADFRRALLIGGAAIVVVQAAVVWLVVSRLVRPVARMTRMATLVADGALDTEVGPPGGSRETAALAVDLDRMLTRLRSTLSASEQSTADAVRSRDDMRRFLADVSHEIRTPLAALRGYSDLYAGGMLGEPGALDRAMQRVGAESQRLHGLVSNMLQLARSQSPGRQPEPFDIAAVVSDVADDLRSAYPRRAVELSITTPVGNLLSGVPGEIHQAVLNLAANACSHTDPDSKVEIELGSTDELVTIDVVDHGPGIDPGEAERIFLPFYRLDSSRTRGSGGGAGLGLALTKQIVDDHGGSIVVLPTPGGGATFRVSLPRRADRPSTGSSPGPCATAQAVVAGEVTGTS